MNKDMQRKLIAEWLGTFSLLATVVGSGIMAERLAGGNVAVALLGNTIPTGAILVVLILVFGPISGAHFNPAVTLTFAIRREIAPQDSIFYVSAQVIGGICGVLVAHIMFDNPLIDPSITVRTGLGQWVGEFVATFGLIGTILGCLKARAEAIPYAVGLYITAAYLVYLINFFCQFGGDYRKRVFRYLCRYCTGRRHGFYRRAITGSGVGDDVFQMAFRRIGWVDV